MCLHPWLGSILHHRVRVSQVFVIEGADSVCYNSDRWRLFNLVLASLDNMSALTFSDLGCVGCELV